MNPDRGLDEYLLFLLVEKGLSPNTHQAYASDLKKFLKYIFEKNIKDMNEVISPVVAGFIELERKRGYLEKSLARELSSIKNFLKYLEGEGKIQPVQLLKDISFRVPNHYPGYLMFEEIKRMMKGALKGRNPERNQLLLGILYGLGLRVSELVELKVGSFNFEDGFLRVVGKGRKTRIVPLFSGAQSMYEDYMKIRNTLGSNVDELFLNKNFKPLGRVGVWKIIKTIAGRVGIKKNIYLVKKNLQNVI